MRFTIFLSFLLLCLHLSAQTIERTHIPIIKDGGSLDFAGVGGLNNPQFSNADLNHDGVLDLLIFDRSGSVWLPFIHNGTVGEADYFFAPQYVTHFPKIKNWVLLRDYDNDGIMDMFSYSIVPGVAGISVFKGFYNADDRLDFEVVPFSNYFYDILHFPGFNDFQNNLYVSSIDIPAIDDIDNDGDMDVVTFDIGGGYVSYYENQAIELGYPADSLIFELVDNCWGRFWESGLAEPLDLSPNIDSCVGKAEFTGERHAGSTVLTLDMDGDGDKEVVLGDVAFSNLNLAMNGGDENVAFMNSQVNDFPAGTTAANIPIFPAAFYVDINNDGVRDLMVAPNQTNISENYAVSWWYKNTGTDDTPIFSLEKNDFLVDEMIDGGSSTSPAFFDYNADGLLDMLIGTDGLYVNGGNFKASLLLYENVGTATEPEFEMVNRNYLGLEQYNLRRVHPAFFDIDSDGDLDLFLGHDSSSPNGTLLYFENTAGENMPVEFADLVPDYQSIDVGQASVPQFVDVDRDGLTDLLIGEKSGNLNYYRNIGLATIPIFNLVDESFGDVDTRETGFVTGYSAPLLIDRNGTYDLLTGSEAGNVTQYADIDGNLMGAFTEVDSSFGGMYVGLYSRVAAVDLTNDGLLEYVVGNWRGGVSFYTEGEGFIPNSVEDFARFRPNFTISPNPTTGKIRIDMSNFSISEAVQVTVYNALGQLLIEEEMTNNQHYLDLSRTSGLYFVQIKTEKGSKVEKVIVQ